MHFEAMDFHSQVAAMFNAEAVIGVRGAGLTNLLFGRGSLRVLEINRSINRGSLPRPWFYVVAMARRQRYTGESVNGHWGLHCRIVRATVI
jgi:capsular polysaccharide biosynthesis protein